jgi:hypothetical protein
LATDDVKLGGIPHAMALNLQPLAMALWSLEFCVQLAVERGFLATAQLRN